MMILLQQLFISCQETIDIKVPEHKPFLVLNSILNAGEPINVSVTASKQYPPAFDTSLIIKNATVRLFEDGFYQEDLVFKESYRNRIYSGTYYSLSGLKPQTGHTYSIDVTAPGYDKISSETSIPEPVPIISVDTNSILTLNGRSTYTRHEATIKFNDPGEQKNYYKLKVFQINRYKALIPVAIVCNDLNIMYFKLPNDGSFGLGEQESNSLILSEIYLSDEFFNGSIYNLKIDIAPLDNGRRLYFRLYSMNEEYFNYVRSYFNQVYKKNDMFSEPYQVYSNIINGAGIFSSSSMSVDSSIVWSF